MPAKRLEGWAPDATPEQLRIALVAAITQKARWQYRVLHRAMGEFDIYVVASRQSYFVPLGVLIAAAALLLPLAAFAAARGANHIGDLGVLATVRVRKPTPPSGEDNYHAVCPSPLCHAHRI